MGLLATAAALLAGAATAQPASPSSSSRALRPQIGETLEQFEARKRGVTPPPRSGSTSLPADRQGHFAADALINGKKVRVLVDTGATLVALSRSDAELLGISVPREQFKYKMITANGVTTAAPVRLDEVQIGDVSVSNVEAVVHQEGGPPMTLLGMSFLGRLAGFETAGRRLILRQ